MQNDIASKVAASLNNEQARQQLIEIIKSQATEIQRRGNRIVDLEDKNDILQKQVNIIATANKQLETMIETLRSERTKLLQEIEEIKNKESVISKQKKVKSSTQQAA
jgi:adenylosuccinate synthase